MKVEDVFAKGIFPVIINAGQDNEIIVETERSIMAQNYSRSLFQFPDVRVECAIKMQYDPSVEHPVGGVEFEL